MKKEKEKELEKYINKIAEICESEDLSFLCAIDLSKKKDTSAALEKVDGELLKLLRLMGVTSADISMRASVPLEYILYQINLAARNTVKQDMKRG